jgi:hypothetical protein
MGLSLGFRIEGLSAPRTSQQLTGHSNGRCASQSGDVYNPQDTTKKNPGQSGDTADRKDREGSEDVEKRRAS